MCNEYNLKKEVNYLRTKCALNGKYSEANENEIIQWLNGASNSYIGFFNDFKTFFEYVNNVNDIRVLKYVNNMLVEVLNNKDKYFYWYDYDNNEITIMEIDDKYNGLKDIILYYVSVLFPNNVDDYYKFISDLDI